MTGGPRGDVDYEVDGHGYAEIRVPDPRIAAHVRDALDGARTVVNVGAGAGSYEPADRRVLAVEPSAAMRAQRPAGSAPVVAGVADALPLATDAVDAAMAMITVHQWPDPVRGLRELRRVARHAVVLLTFDGAALDRFWLAEYSPELVAAERRRYPRLDLIAEVLGGDVAIHDVAIPADCTDGFTEAFYARPGRFLDPAVRAAQSAWSFVDDAAERRAVHALQDDLSSGAWEQRHGALRRQPTYTGSLRLVVSVPA